MENLQDFIYARLPPSLLSTLSTHTSTYFRIYGAIVRARSAVFAAANRFLNPLLTRLLHEPDIASFLLLVVVLFVSMKLLDLLWRTLMFWVRLAFRLLLVAAVAGVGVWIWSRGFNGCYDDVRWIGQVWWREYEGWQRRAEMASLKENVGRQFAGDRRRSGANWRR